MMIEELTPNKIKEEFERLFVSPINGAIPLKKNDYMLFMMLSTEQIMEMKDLAKRCKKYEDAYNKSSNKFSWELNHSRQYRDLREDFVEKLHILNKGVAKDKTIKIYSPETLADTTIALQLEHAKALKAKATKKNCCKWIRPGETIIVNDILLSRGFFYVGDYFKIPQSYKEIKAFDFRHREYRDHNRNYKLSKIYGTVICTDLPISRNDLAMVPFSSYLDMHPTQRYEYLQWLAGNKTISEITPATFLFYLYGLQLRMFIDDTASEQDRLNIVKHAIDLYTQCREEDVYYYELEHFIDAAISKFFVNSLEELAPKNIIPKLQLCREALILDTRNIDEDKTMENICRNVFFVLNHDNSIGKHMLTDSFFSQFAKMVESELQKMSYVNNWKQLINVIKEPENSGIYEQYCINSPKEYSILLYDYIFNIKLFPNTGSLGFFNQCINNCYKRIVKRIGEYSILALELPSQISSTISLFDTDNQNIHTKIHRVITEGEEFATIEKETDVTEYTIDNVASANIQSVLLSNEQLEKVEEQTKQAQDLLSDIFEDDGDSIESTARENKVFLAILKILLSKELWKREEVESLCKEHHLMIGSVLEQINDFSYTKIEDAVIEDDGDTIYVMTEYKDKLI